MSETLSATLFWDGIYNIKPDGSRTAPNSYCNKPMLVPPPPLEPFERDLPISQPVVPAAPRAPRAQQTPILATLKAWTVDTVVASDADVRTALNSITLPQIKVRVGDRYGENHVGVANEFLPYEDLLAIPIHLKRADRIQSLMLRIFRGIRLDPNDASVQARDDRRDRDAVHLVYQEIFDQQDVVKLLLFRPEWRESPEERRARQSRYWGAECFANWYHHHYTIELWASTQPNAFDACDGGRHPRESLPDTVHNHSMPAYIDSWDTAHQSWSYAMRTRVAMNEREFKRRVDKLREDKDAERQRKFVSALGYNVTVAVDVIHQAYNYDNDPAEFPWLDDFSRLQRLLRNKPKFSEHIAHVERYLAEKPRALLSEALEYHERIVSFPVVQVIPLSVLKPLDFTNLVARVYALDDIGAGTSHGMWTHRLQWTALASLVTDKFTVPKKADLFFHTPLQLYAKVGSAYPQNHDQADGRFPQKISLWGFLFDRANVPGGIRDRHVEERLDGHFHHPDNFHFNLIGFGLDFAQIEPAFDALSSSRAEADPYEHGIVIASELDEQLTHEKTQVHFWVGRFMERVTKFKGKGSPPDVLGVRAWTWSHQEEQEKPVGILKLHELHAAAEAIKRFGTWRPDHPSLADRLLRIWLEFRIAQDCMAKILPTSQLERWFKTIEDDLNRADGVDKYALFPNYPWTLPLRDAAATSSRQLFRFMIGYEGRPIDAIIPVGSNEITDLDLQRLLQASEALVHQGPPAQYQPVAVQIF